MSRVWQKFAERATSPAFCAVFLIEWQYFAPKYLQKQHGCIAESSCQCGNRHSSPLVENKKSRWRADMKDVFRGLCTASETVVKRLAVMCAAFGIAMMAQGAQAQSSQTAFTRYITVNSDAGGSLYHYAWKISAAAQDGSKVRLRGHCQSACTLYLAMPPEQICISPSARFSFHLPYGASRTANQMAAEYMLRKYPQWVRNWIAAKGGLSNRMIHMSNAYAAQFVQPCASQAPTRSAAVQATPRLAAVAPQRPAAVSTVSKASYSPIAPAGSYVRQAARPQVMRVASHAPRAGDR